MISWSWFWDAFACFMLLIGISGILFGLQCAFKKEEISIKERVAKLEVKVEYLEARK